MSLTEWKPPVRPWRLSPDEVHVWRLVVPEGGKGFVDKILTPEERLRAERIISPVVRHRFITVRTALRRLLGGYLEMDPAEVKLVSGPRGKPCLEAGEAPALRFNLSHSGDLALMAVALTREVGVDVERVRPGRQVDRIARRYFAPEEVAALEKLSPEERLHAFYLAWTRKEAYLKATGEGIVRGLAGIRVTLLPDEEPALLGTDWHPPEVHRWTLRSLAPGPGYVGALVAEGQDWQFRCFGYQP